MRSFFAGGCFAGHESMKSDWTGVREANLELQGLVVLLITSRSSVYAADLHVTGLIACPVAA